MEDILTKYFLSQLSNSEKKELFLRMKSDESLRTEYIRLQNLYALAHLAQHTSHEAEGVEAINRFKVKLQALKRQRKMQLLLQYAAVSLLLIASTVIFTRHFSENSSLPSTLNSLYVPAGQRAQLTLHDGTTAWLNAGSTLTYPAQFSKRQREVTLVGEAYFDVAENHEIPFVVKTQQLTMEVLGTEFNVYSYPESGYSQVSLVEGSVRVSKPGEKEKSVLLSPNQQVTLCNNTLKLEKLTNPEHLLWRNGIYAFDNERLIDIIKKLELYYDVTIKVEDPNIFDVRYTGKFRQRDGIDEILYILQKIQTFKILKDKEKNIITLLK